MRRILLSCTILLASVSLSLAQSHRIYFKDKGANQSMISNPYLFLSPKAVERKASYGITIDQSDLPVDPSYLEELKNLGLRVEMSSRWFNYAKVSGLTDPKMLARLGFIRKVEEVQQFRVAFAGSDQVMFADTLDYGIASNQIEMVNGNYLHDRGFKGQGMTIAVLDGGFTGTKNMPGMDSLWLNNRVKGTYNFAQNDTNVFVGGTHGTLVLSVLAGFIDSSYAGSAVMADYYLFKTEVEESETPAEMDNWLRAAERADSLGVDVISSSLGYFTFDGGVGDYTYADMDGNTTVVTKAADKAAEKGILVIVSAGNEGNDEWKYITAPADGDSVLAIGAVAPDGSYVNFSSVGPTSDGRIKPDVSAQGLAAAIINAAGPTFGNGTSFSCPIISGLAACLWQSSPGMTNMQILEAIRSNASQPFTPDNQKGFGIANFRDASWGVGEIEIEALGITVEVYPNPIGDTYNLEMSGISNPIEASINLFDINGKPIESFEIILNNSEAVSIKAPEAEGAYILSISTPEGTYLKKLLK